MNIAFYDIKNQDILSVNFVIPVGFKSIYYGKINNFVHLIEHLFFHGHPEYTQYELMLKLEEMGAIVNADTNDYYTELYMRIHKKHLLEGVRLLSNAILSFDIRRDDYESEKEIIRIEEVGGNRPTQLLVSNIAKCFHKINKDRIPSYNKLKKIYETIYTNWSLVIIGDINDDIKYEVYSLYGNTTVSNVKFTHNLFTTEMTNNKFYFNNKIDKKNMFVYIHRCSEYTGLIEMKLIKNIYTVGLTSVLYDYLVAEHNYCYSVHFQEYMVENKFFAIYFLYEGIQYKELRSYFETIFTENFIDNLCIKHFERSINMIITQTLLKMENNSSIMNDIIENYIFNQDVTVNKNILEQIENLNVQTAKDIVRKALLF